MATLPTNFLKPTLHGAKEHGIEAHPLSDNKGLLLFAEGLTVSEQCSLLKEIAADLHAADITSEPQGQQTENSEAASPQTNIDCQVTVEERAQLFKFITG